MSCTGRSELAESGFKPLSSVQFSRSVLSNSLRPHGVQHARLSCPTPTPRAYLNSCPSSWWCHPTISSSVFPFSSCLQSFPASGSFPMSQFFISGCQSFRLPIHQSKKTPTFYLLMIIAGNLENSGLSKGENTQQPRWASLGQLCLHAGMVTPVYLLCRRRLTCFA